MCLCGDWDPRQVDRKIANRKYRNQMLYGDPRGPRPSGMMDGDPYGEMTVGGIMDGPPRIGLPPGLAAGMATRGGSPRSSSGMPGPRSSAGGGSRRGDDIHSGSRRGESRHADGSRRGSGRYSSMYEASNRPGRDPVGPRPFNNRGGPPPAGGGAWMQGALGGSRANVGRGRSGSRGRSPARGNPPPDYQTHASGMATIRGPMPPGMQMGGRTGSRRTSRSRL